MEYFLKHTIGFDDYITGNRFIDICIDSDIQFCKTDFISQHNNREYETFVTHNSDYHINKQRYDCGPKASTWYAQNKDIDLDNIISIPIGIENMKLRNNKYLNHSSEVKNALFKANMIDRYSGFGLEKTGLVYMNFNPATYPSEREYVWKMSGS